MAKFTLRQIPSLFTGANLNRIKPIKVIDTKKKKDFFFNHIV